MFKVGDRVRGISKAYTITKTGWKGVVVEVRKNCIVVQDFRKVGSKDDKFCVDPEYFELFDKIHLTESYV